MEAAIKSYKQALVLRPEFPEATCNLLHTLQVMLRFHLYLPCFLVKQKELELYIYMSVCVYICMYIYVYIYVYKYMYIYLCVCLYIYMYIYIYILLEAWTV